MSAVITVPPAGWYEDDMVPGRERWWDGDRWSDRVRRTEFGLDCWASEQHRARTVVADAPPAAHLAHGGRWTELAAEPTVDPAGESTTVVADVVADVVAGGGTGGLAAVADAPVDTWHSAIAPADEMAEIGPIVVQVVAIGDLADTSDEQWAAKTRRDETTRGTRASKNKKRRDRAAETPRRQAGAGAVVAEPQGVGPMIGGMGEDWAASAETAVADGDAWTATLEGASLDVGWIDEAAVVPSPDAEPATTHGSATPLPADRMTGRPLADAAAVMAALAALSAPLDDPTAPAPTRPARPPATTSSAPVGSTSWSSSATANAAERAAARAAAASAAQGSPKASEQEWAKEAAGEAAGSTDAGTVDDRTRRRSAPPRPSFAPNAEGAGTSTSHTFTKIDREALDAAMALSSMLSPSSASRPPSPAVLGPRPVATNPDTPPAPVAPVEQQPDAPADVKAPAVRRDRPSRPAPPVPRWSDQQPSDDEADTGFVKISSRDRQKRVLGT